MLCLCEHSENKSSYISIMVKLIMKYVRCVHRCALYLLCRTPEVADVMTKGSDIISTLATLSSVKVTNLQWFIDDHHALRHDELKRRHKFVNDFVTSFNRP